MSSAPAPERSNGAAGPLGLPMADAVGVPADELAGLLDRALDGNDPDIPAAFDRDGAPYSLEELLSGLPPIETVPERAPDPPPPPEPPAAPEPIAAPELIANPEPSADPAQADDVLVLTDSMEEEDAADTVADDPTTLALSSIASALQALAWDDDPPPADDAADDVLVLTDDFLAEPSPALDGGGQECSEDANAEAAVVPAGDDTSQTLQSIVDALRALTEPPAAAPPASGNSDENEDEDEDVLLLSDVVEDPPEDPPPAAEPDPPPPEPQPVPAPNPAPNPAIDGAGIATLVDAIIAAHAPLGTHVADQGESALPERLDALALLLSDPPPERDFAALDALYTCWPKGTQDSASRALLATAQNLSRNFGLPGKLPMSSAKAWRMLSPTVFESELAQRLAAVGSFIADWQKTQRTFLILEFSEIELIEYLFEALHPGYHADILAEVMNFKVLSNRRTGLLRRIPNRVKKQITPLLPDGKDKALVELAHAKAFLDRVGADGGFAPIVEAAAKAREEIEKMMKAVANIGAPPPPPGPGGGLALGRIG